MTDILQETIKRLKDKNLEDKAVLAILLEEGFLEMIGRVTKKSQAINAPITAVVKTLMQISVTCYFSVLTNNGQTSKLQTMLAAAYLEEFNKHLIKQTAKITMGDQK